MDVESHAPCSYVAKEIGDEYLLLGAFPDVAVAIAENIEAAHRRRARELPGAGAAPALASLACESCILADTCGVRQVLENHKLKAAALGRLVPIITDLQNAPPWLQAARTQLSGYPADAILHEEARRLGQDAAPVCSDIVRAGVATEVQEDKQHYTKKELPELQLLAIPNEVMTGLTLTTEYGHRFVIIDASQGQLHINITEEAFGVLAAKLVSRIVEQGADGTPHILSPDQKMQKTIRPVEGGRLDEIRMSGKNRLYLTVYPIDETSTRIVLLGAHGGNAATQQRFISMLLGR